MTECCELMTLALSRVHESDRLGLMRERFYSRTTFKSTREALVLRMHKERGDKQRNTAAWLVLNYCPFCGVRVNVESAKRARKGKL